MISEADLCFKGRRAFGKISENIHIVANDPSLAFFRIQEHVRKVVAPIIDKKSEVNHLHSELQGHCYDMEYAVSAVKNIEYSDSVFKNVQDMLKTSIYFKEQLKSVAVKKRSKKETTGSSVYKRFSAHLTLDLPDFPDLGEVMRETTHRMENIILANRVEVSKNVELQRSHTTLH